MRFLVRLKEQIKKFVYKFHRPCDHKEEEEEEEGSLITS